ncbi:MAG: acetyl-CoA carboxylase biotin carboxyl carrier protein subunit [Prevotellaceae bacterium]|jgi:biotin carboxyl carrier protein|nr:acetyl-CoA carboxylase biotin carboxyl carrier protein subunit [Prevotellaceae bacterium]
MKGYKLKINGNDYKVVVKDVEGSTAEVEVNGTHYHVEVERPTAQVSKTPKLVQVATVPSSDSHQATAKTAAPGAASAVKSPLPGVILDVYVKEGETVAVGQKLLLLEAMKMENSVEADHAGKVTAVKVSKGDSILEGAVLVIIE